MCITATPQQKPDDDGPQAAKESSRAEAGKTLSSRRDDRSIRREQEAARGNISGHSVEVQEIGSARVLVRQDAQEK